MGNYASQADLKARFENDAAVAHLTDTPDSGVPDSDVLDEVINHAEGQVDSSCAMRYKVPITVAGNAGLASMMKSATLDLAVFHLYARGQKITEATELAHDKVMAWLEKISEGKLVLPSPATEPSTETRDPLIAFGTVDTDSDASKRIFTRETQGAL